LVGAVLEASLYREDLGAAALLRCLTVSNTADAVSYFAETASCRRSQFFRPREVVCGTSISASACFRAAFARSKAPFSPYFLIENLRIDRLPSGLVQYAIQEARSTGPAAVVQGMPGAKRPERRMGCSNV
jgi:hypothetical protein